jgi:hypothetical protein
MALKLSLKAATTKTTPKTTAPVASSEAMAAATEYRNIALEMDRVKAELAVAREALMDIVGDVREDALRSGVVENVKIPTSDGNKVQVIYQERFSGLDAENVPALKGAFGKDYKVLVNESAKVGLRRGTTMEDIESAIGKAAAKKLLAVLDVTEQVSPAKGAYKAIANLFKKGDDEKAEDLLMFTTACAARPSVRAK